ncbi:tyramine receptor 1-like [Strongylocentrotus purpuratus]|uniref:G-protein coupled receptors family 1 profile domain-containing protein n=1 Tax=Strongylocentrotus purpuratus TaxID=7668 RepID=A0A7M7HKI1_STRPU|nr:tyramine receptor 1-like [Strongylocentrotus purpuratus]
MSSQSSQLMDECVDSGCQQRFSNMPSEVLVSSTTRPELRCAGYLCLAQSQIIGFFVFDIVIAVVILIGNTLVILSVARTPSLRSQNNIFLASLAVVDFLLAIICIPLDIIAGLGFMPDVSPWACLSLSAVIATMVFLTILHITVVAFDRFLAITSPFTYQQTMTNGRVACFIAGVWLITLVISSSAFAWNNVHEFDDTACDLLFIQDKSYRLLTVLLIMCVPLTLMSYWYFRIYRVARSHRRRIAALERVLETKAFARAKYGTTLKKDLKAAVTIMFVFGLFVIGWLPASFMTIIDVIVPDVHRDEVYIYELICFKIAFSNSAMNPMIYAARNMDFRRAFARQLGLSQKKSTSRTNGQTSPVKIGQHISKHGRGRRGKSEPVVESSPGQLYNRRRWMSDERQKETRESEDHREKKKAFSGSQYYTTFKGT